MSTAPFPSNVMLLSNVVQLNCTFGGCKVRLKHCRWAQARHLYKTTKMNTPSRILLLFSCIFPSGKLRLEFLPLLVSVSLQFCSCSPLATHRRSDGKTQGGRPRGTEKEAIHKGHQNVWWNVVLLWIRTKQYMRQRVMKRRKKIKK